MIKSAKVIVTISIILLIVAVVYGIKSFVKSRRPLAKGALISVRIKGNADAPLKITEFIDFQCPACAAGAKYLKSFMTQHPSMVQLRMKYYPLRMHSHGFLSAKYAECAGQQGQFWPFHDYLVNRQKLWMQLEDAKPAFDLMAQEVNLDLDVLASCLENPKVDEIINKDRKEGEALGIRSTPTYVVNGDIIVGMKSLQNKLTQFLQKK